MQQNRLQSKNFTGIEETKMEVVGLEENTEIQSDDIESTLRSWCNNSQFTDFYFVTEDSSKKFHVHKLVLAIKSPVLSDIIYKPDNPKCITIELGDEDAIQNIIRFCYEDQVILDDLSHIKETKTLSDKYEIFKLSEICNEALGDIPVTSTNVFDALEISKEFKNEAKEKECMKFISENLELDLILRQLMHLPFEAILLTLEQLKNMNLISERKFLNLTVNWIAANDPENLKYQELVMEKLVNLTEVPVDDYFDLIKFYVDSSSLKENIIFSLIKKFHGAVVFEKEESRTRGEQMQLALDEQKMLLEETQHKSNQLEKLIKEMQDKLDQQDKNFKEKQSKLYEQENSIREMQHTLNQQEKNNEERKQKLDQQENDIESIKNKMFDQVNNFKAMQLKLDQQEKHNQEKKSISDKQEKHIAVMHVNLSQHEKLLEDRKCRIHQQENHMKQMQHHLDEQAKHIGEIVCRLDQQDKYSKERQRKLDEQQKQIGEMQHKLDQQGKDIEQKKQMLYHQEKLIGEMQFKLSQQEKYNRDTKEDFDKQEKSIGEIGRKLDQQNKKNESMQKSIKDCNFKIDRQCDLLKENQETVQKLQKSSNEDGREFRDGIQSINRRLNEQYKYDASFTPLLRSISAAPYRGHL